METQIATLVYATEFCEKTQQENNRKLSLFFLSLFYSLENGRRPKSNVSDVDLCISYFGNLPSNTYIISLT